MIPAVVARYKLADSTLFERLRQREQLAAMPSFKVFKKHARPIILIALVVAFTAMDGFVSSTYSISFMKSAASPLPTTAIIMMFSRVGWRSRIWLVMAIQFPIGLFGMGLLKGLAPILTSESFPIKFRYSGTGISYNVGARLGGMIAPSLLAGLIGPDVLHKWYYVPNGLRLIFCRVDAGAPVHPGNTGPAWRISMRNNRCGRRFLKRQERCPEPGLGRRLRACAKGRIYIQLLSTRS